MKFALGYHWTRARKRYDRKLADRRRERREKEALRQAAAKAEKEARA